MGLMDYVPTLPTSAQPDCLKADDPVPEQTHCLVSLMKDKNDKVIGIKIRAAGDSSVKDRADGFRDQNQDYDVYSLEIGKWTPLPGTTLEQLNKRAGEIQSKDN